MNSESYGIVVSVGTDHHRFDRLIDWVDLSLESWGSQEPPRCLVQYGASRKPRNADGVERLPREQLLELYRQADVVVVQGGPGSILDAREIGRVPLAVPRDPGLREVVDAHQAAFSAVMAQHGNAVVVDSWEAFHRQLMEMSASPENFTTAPRVANPELAAARIAEHIDRILAEPPRRRGRFIRRLRQVLRRSGD